ncbi:hypothetical protein [Streptomyces sp. P9-A4]|uniref:hypothetical protein n=1 Tax=Streptomyces sp. P9-A4 TaxID=3072285 RepID=UPI002FC8504D
MGLVVDIRFAPVLRSKQGEAFLRTARHHVRLRHLPKPFDVRTAVPGRKFGSGDNAADAQIRPPGRGRLVDDDGAAGPLPAALFDH